METVELSMYTHYALSMVALSSFKSSLKSGLLLLVDSVSRLIAMVAIVASSLSLSKSTVQLTRLNCPLTVSHMAVVTSRFKELSQNQKQGGSPPPPPPLSTPLEWVWFCCSRHQLVMGPSFCLDLQCRKATFTSISSITNASMAVNMVASYDIAHRISMIKYRSYYLFSHAIYCDYYKRPATRAALTWIGEINRNNNSLTKAGYVGLKQNFKLL